MHSRRLRFGARILVAFLFVLSSMPSVAMGEPTTAPAAQGTAGGFQVQYPPPPKPLLAQIPEAGVGINFQLVGHNPLIDNDLIPGLSPMGEHDR